MDPERERLAEDERRERNWKRWGSYLAERQWGTVREDYSPDGSVWTAFTHEAARSRAYRWGEDGLLGITDRECRLALAPALWNGEDPILKERLFGLSGPEGNHGEDVKEVYHYLDATPTSSYLRGLYKYPQRAFPYQQLLDENRHRGRGEPEYELADTGALDEHWDLEVEYAKASPDDLFARFTVTNRGRAGTIHLLPTVWFRNTWSWGRSGEGYWPEPRIARTPEGLVLDHASLGRYFLTAAPQRWLFTNNETNYQRLWNVPNRSRFVKDAFHDHLIHGASTLNPEEFGTKAAALYRFELTPGASATVELRLHSAGSPAPPRDVFALRKQEADAFHAELTPDGASPAEARVLRQGHAGLLWSKQFYHYVVGEWLDGDPGHPPPAASRRLGPNADWRHLHSRDVLSVPDKWEYPWFAAWDLAFHMVPMAALDPAFAKEQLILFLREWYQHPNGQLPAYEFAFPDVNPPVHAWAVWRIYKMTGARGARDRLFLERAFGKLLFYFSWWVNRKDLFGHHLFSGGFLGLDNIGVFDRSRPLPTGGTLQQADGTAWVAFFCGSMLAIALELARENPAYEDLASKFFEHFMAIADAMNSLGGSGLWDEEDGFYYDRVIVDGQSFPLRIRSMVGLVPLFVIGSLEEETLAHLPGFKKRMDWFLANRRDLARQISIPDAGGHSHRQIAIPSRERLVRVLRYVLDENEFLSPFGVRSLSKVHAARPFRLRVGAEDYRVDYEPGDSRTGTFGGNSNWRGPVWLPMNYLLVEALHRSFFFYGDGLKVECPTGSGVWMNLEQIALEISRRQTRLFLPDERGRVASLGDTAWPELLLFYEYFHGDTGLGLGASHQTGWTALATRYVDEAIRRR